VGYDTRPIFGVKRVDPAAPRHLLGGEADDALAGRVQVQPVAVLGRQEDPERRGVAHRPEADLGGLQRAVDALALDRASHALRHHLQQIRVALSPGRADSGGEPGDADQHAVHDHRHQRQRAIALGRDQPLDGCAQKLVRARHPHHSAAAQARQERLRQDLQRQAGELGQVLHGAQVGRVPFVGQREHPRDLVQLVIERAVDAALQADRRQRARDGLVGDLRRQPEQRGRDDRRDTIVVDIVITFVAGPQRQDAREPLQLPCERVALVDACINRRHPVLPLSFALSSCRRRAESDL
jgi:hypothetical protein